MHSNILHKEDNIIRHTKSIGLVWYDLVAAVAVVYVVFCRMW